MVTVFVVYANVKNVQTQRRLLRDNIVNVIISHAIDTINCCALDQTMDDVYAESVNVMRVGLAPLVIVEHQMTLACHRMEERSVRDMELVNVVYASK